MKRIIIVCEGQTEQSFCNDVLKPYFTPLGIYIETPTIKKTNGGIVNWAALKHQLEKHLLEDKTAIVTTFIDYYGIYAHHKYPNWLAADQRSNKSECMELLEEGMYGDIKPDLMRNFLPYIQLHEFEGLLFSDITAFDNNFEEDEFFDYEYLVRTINAYPNAELINNGAETAPSKRLLKIIKVYDKIVYGSLLAQEIGLTKIRSKCPRFDAWITRIEKAQVV